MPVVSRRPNSTPFDPAQDYSAERLNQDVALARRLAAHEVAPSSLLRDLSHHSDRAVRRRVARNPATPAEIAVLIGSEFPSDLLDNPAFDLQTILIIENMPKWEAATQNGKAVNCYQVLPIKFGQ